MSGCSSGCGTHNLIPRSKLTTFSQLTTHTITDVRYLVLLNGELSDQKVGVRGLGLKCHQHLPVLDGFLLLVGEEGIGGLTSFLVHVAEHDHCPALKLVQHPPDVIHGVLQRPLCSYVGIALLVALQGRQRNVDSEVLLQLNTWAASATEKC